MLCCCQEYAVNRLLEDLKVTRNLDDSSAVHLAKWLTYVRCSFVRPGSSGSAAAEEIKQESK